MISQCDKCGQSTELKEFSPNEWLCSTCRNEERENQQCAKELNA